MSESTAVTRSPAVALRTQLERYTERLAVWGVEPGQYINAALIAATKVPALYECSPASIALALQQAAQTGLDIGRTAHLVPFKGQATFVPDYKGLIDLATATGKVVAIRTRCVYEGEEFAFFETAAGPDIRHVPRLTGGASGKIVGAYAIADLRYQRAKVEWMTAEEIETIRKGSRSWAKGPLPDWYARKTVVRRLCKTLPGTPKLHAALRYDDAEGEQIPDAEVTPVEVPKRIVSGATIGAVVTGDAYGHGDAMPSPETARENAKRWASTPDPYEVEELPGSLPMGEEAA